MAAIEVDFDVYKALTAQRDTEQTTYNDVIRRLLNMQPPATDQTHSEPDGLIMKGVSFPEGTEFRVTYKGRTYGASVQSGRWVGFDGMAHPSPSRAAQAITGTNVNGWRFWSAKRPGDLHWRRLDDCR